MESDYQDSSEYEASENDTDNDALRLAPNSQIEHIVSSPRHSPLKDGRYSAKWNSLKGHYNPKYRDLLHGTSQTIDDDAEANLYETTQHGAIIWTGDEKVRLFRALERRGRRDMSALSDHVQTKSEIEIKAYLDLLQQAELDRQLYERHPQNASIIDIPAATEVGKGLERVLDRAAAAMEAHQEQYDYAVAARGSVPDFIIDHDVARQIDARIDLKEERQEFEEDMVEHEGLPELFRLSAFVDLSTKIFMIGTPELPKEQDKHKFMKSEVDDWMSLAFGEETPAITKDAISDYHAITTSLIQRLIQASIFCAESRLRASTTQHWAPSREVKKEDVYLALDLLKLEGSTHQYWLKWPRRSGVAVWSGSHRKGASSKQGIDIDTVEDMLSQPNYRGRHSRSASVSSVSSVSTDSVISTEPVRDSIEVQHNPADDDYVASSPSGDDVSEHSSEVSEASIGSAVEESEEHTSSGEDDSDREAVEPSQRRKSRLSSQKRQRLLEKRLDQHLKELDARQSQEERERIEDLLDLGDGDRIKEESEPPRKRPRISRKTIEDVEGWQAPPLAMWEIHEDLPELKRNLASVHRGMRGKPD